MLKVEVLLATFNGEKYIAEFLDSLTKQIGVEIDLVISDDGSTDSTLEIVKFYEGRFKSIKILAGPQKGPSENFFYLLKNSEGPVIAFADQDDIWLPNHLLDACYRILNEGSKPCITFSSVLEFREFHSKKFDKWPTRFPISDIRSVICENLARGCTLVINKEMKKILNSHHPQKGIMHDWWILLVAYCYGTVVWTKDVEIYYRIHENNFTKSKRHSISHYYKLIRSKDWKVLDQAKELAELRLSESVSEQHLVLKRWKESLEGYNWSNLLKNILFIGRYRSQPFEDMVIRFFMVYIAVKGYVRRKINA